MTAERTILVTGRGEMRIPPDTVNLTLTIERVQKDYAAAVDECERAARAAVGALTSAGIGGENVRALSLRTDARYDMTEENGVRRRTFAGYAAVRRIRAQFACDGALLARVLTALAGCGASPEIAAEYALKDEEALHGELLALSVRDARRRAEAMAVAAGVKLGCVLTMDSRSHGVPLVRAAALRMDGAAELQPEEIVLTDEVQITYSIE